MSQRLPMEDKLPEPTALDVLIWLSLLVTVPVLAMYIKLRRWLG